MQKLTAVCVLALLTACGGGSSSPTPVTATTPPPRDGLVVLAGAIGGKFTLSSSPVVHRDGHRFGCGDATITIPYRETAGGSAVGGDYEIKILDNTGFASRIAGKATNVSVGPNESGTITVTDSFICAEWFPTTAPPRAQVAMNFGGKINGTVSQIAGVGPLAIIE